MEKLSIWVVSIIMLAFSIRYSYQIKNKKIQPTLSTWLIFLLGTCSSLLTFMVTDTKNLSAGILNIMDTVAIVIIIISTLLWGKRSKYFKAFEKWYLVSILLIGIYGIVSKNTFNSNLLTQLVIAIGYFPTIQNLIKEKRNTESFTAWGLAYAAGIISLYPALLSNSFLATIYSIRTIVLTSIILFLMSYFKFQLLGEKKVITTKFI
jgi:hypothetical protein